MLRSISFQRDKLSEMDTKILLDKSYFRSAEVDESHITEDDDGSR